MALATQCPHCKTTFRVAQDQLKLRAGLVRCGSCKEIFNGIEHLLVPEGAPVKPAPTSKAHSPTEKEASPREASSVSAPVSTVGAATAAPASIEDASSAGIPISILVSTPAPASSALDFIYPDPEPEPEPISEPEPEPEQISPETITDDFVDFVEVPRQPKEPTFEEPVFEEPAIAVPPVEEHGATDITREDPLQRMTLVDFSDDTPAEPAIEEIVPASPSLPEEPDPLDQVIDELKRKPLRGKKKPKPYARRPTQEIQAEASVPETPEAEEPEFVKQGRRKQTVGRTMHIAMGVGSLILLLAALGQATYAFRDQIAARIPESKPALIAVCALLDCKIGLPTQIEAITIESDQLETLNSNKDASELTMLLRNGSATTQAWPYLELTLNDANNTMLSRRVFAPREFLPATQEEKKGFAPNSEQTIKLYFEFTGTKPAGYHIGVFYP